MLAAQAQRQADKNRARGGASRLRQRLIRGRQGPNALQIKPKKIGNAAEAESADAGTASRIIRASGAAKHAAAGCYWVMSLGE
jgi:hypothetical protein